MSKIDILYYYSDFLFELLLVILWGLWFYSFTKTLTPEIITALSKNFLRLFFIIQVNFFPCNE